MPKTFPILTPKAEVKNVNIPINEIAATMFTSGKSANVMPTAKASILVAIAKWSIVLKSRESF